MIESPAGLEQVSDLLTQLEQSKENEVKTSFNEIQDQYVKSQQTNEQLRREVKCLVRKREICN